MKRKQNEEEKIKEIKFIFLDLDTQDLKVKRKNLVLELIQENSMEFLVQDCLPYIH